MTLPAGITTCTVTIGKALGSLFEDATLSGTVTVDRRLVWVATGDTIYEVPSSAPKAQFDGGLAFQVAHVDQAGFVDQSGNSITGFSYTFSGRATFTDGSVEPIVKHFQAFVGETTKDLDLVPDGPATLPVVTPNTSVYSVAGKTGVVTVADLVATGVVGAPDYASGITYSVGQLVASSGTVYRVITAHTSSGAIDLSKFAAVGGSGGGGAVASVNAKTGVVLLVASDVGATPAAHASDTNNPHSTTKAQVGLGNVDNTADTAKPVSTLQAAADTAAQSAATAAASTDATTKANAAQAFAVQRANHTGTQSLDTTADSATRLALTSTERTKLAGVATGATANATDAQLRDRSTHTGTQAVGTITGLGALATKIAIAVPGDVTATGTASATTYLRGDGSWATPAGGGSSPVSRPTVPGLYYDVSISEHSGQGSGNTDSGYTYYLPMIAARNHTIDTLGIRVAGTASGALARLAIYADDGLGQPGALVIDAGELDASSPGFRSIAITPAGLTGGSIYHLAVRTSTAVNVQTGDTYGYPQLGRPTGGVGNGYRRGFHTSTYGAAFASTAPAVTRDTATMTDIFYRVGSLT